MQTPKTDCMELGAKMRAAHKAVDATGDEAAMAAFKEMHDFAWGAWKRNAYVFGMSRNGDAIAMAGGTPKGDPPKDTPDEPGTGGEGDTTGQG